MITLITGAPGAGKSACVVSLLQELSKDRPLFVDGIPDLVIDHEEVDASKWPESVPDGAVIVVDEVQRIWRARGPGRPVPPEVAALETHRHRGLDFYIITQMPRLLDSNVRALVGRHIHLRDLGVLGRWWYEWPECNDQCASAWKNAPIRKRYKLPKRIFGQYKSASEHIKPVRSFPFMLLVMIAAVIITGFMGWYVWTMIHEKTGLSGDVAKTAFVDPTALDQRQFPQQQTVARKRGIDDRIDWIPRHSNRPESAPAYDHLRVVRNMPVVAAAICSAERCVCYTQQATDALLSSDECRQWMERRPFDPYREQPSSSGSSATRMSDEAPRGAQRTGEGGDSLPVAADNRRGSWPL